MFLIWFLSKSPKSPEQQHDCCLKMRAVLPWKFLKNLNRGRVSNYQFSAWYVTELLSKTSNLVYSFVEITDHWFLFFMCTFFPPLPPFALLDNQWKKYMQICPAKHLRIFTLANVVASVAFGQTIASCITYFLVVTVVASPIDERFYDIDVFNHFGVFFLFNKFTW